MGIKDLLRFMKPFIKPIHICKYQGKRVGIDAYSWLHKGAYACSMEICMNESWADARAPFVHYFMHRIHLLRHHQIVPVVIFDGGCIPCKSATELQRQRRREENRSLAEEKLSQGDVLAATEFFQRAISITPDIAHQLIQVLRTEQVEFIVAPYEADPQLAYLSKLEEDEGGISAVITEDSDLLAYGCKAVIFKMDRCGRGEELLMDGVFNSCIDGLSFRDFTQDLFTGMCVIAGCDFLPSVTGIGIKRAHSLVSKYRNLDRVLSVLKIQKGKQVPEGYVKAFRETIAVFQHATIYDPHGKVVRPMKQVPLELFELLGNDVEFLGPIIDAPTAIGIAEGCIDPLTFESFHRHQPKIFEGKQLSCFTIFNSKESTEAGLSPLTKHKKQGLKSDDIPGTHDGSSFISEAASLEEAYVVNSAINPNQIMEQETMYLIHEVNHTKNDRADDQNIKSKSAALKQLAATNSPTIFSQMMKCKVVSSPDRTLFSNKQLKKEKPIDDADATTSPRLKKSLSYKMEENGVDFADKYHLIMKNVGVGDDADRIDNYTGKIPGIINEMEEQETMAFPGRNYFFSSKNKRTGSNPVNEMEQMTLDFLGNKPFSDLNKIKRKICDGGPRDSVGNTLYFYTFKVWMHFCLQSFLFFVEEKKV